MHCTLLLGALELGSADPRLPHLHRRGRDPSRQHLSAARHQPRRPHRLPARRRRADRLDDVARRSRGRSTARASRAVTRVGRCRRSSTQRRQTDLSTGTLTALRDFPERLEEAARRAARRVLADAQAAADAFITKSGRKPKMGHEGPIIKDPTPEQLRFPAEFSESADYVLVGGYEKGGDNCLGPKDSCTRCCRRRSCSGRSTTSSSSGTRRTTSPCSCARCWPQPTLGGHAAEAGARPVQARHHGHGVRDLGSTRFPQVMMVLSSGLIFAVACHALHRRDKQIMALRAAGSTDARHGLTKRGRTTWLTTCRWS